MNGKRRKGEKGRQRRKRRFPLVLEGTNDIVRGIRGHRTRPPRILKGEQQFILTGPQKYPEDQSQITDCALHRDRISSSLSPISQQSRFTSICFSRILFSLVFPFSRSIFLIFSRYFCQIQAEYFNRSCQTVSYTSESMEHGNDCFNIYPNLRLRCL